MNTTSSKFLTGLCKQIKSVYNKIEFCYLALPLKIITEVSNIMKGKCGLSAALGVPDDTVFDTRIQLLLDSQGCKKTEDTA